MTSLINKEKVEEVLDWWEACALANNKKPPTKKQKQEYSVIIDLFFTDNPDASVMSYISATLANGLLYDYV